VLPEIAGVEGTLEKFSDWVGERAQAGRMAPQGFPKNNRFGDAGL